ncbi:MBL fold metallo-hydrolase [Sulfitobacter mediterraneus]|jgi:glyoxylase-like metal-dependent hydrolase (beta-lactamase superfamily II)|uniref:MBL fold metallo-hydrolase n=1 Tax=Sulfitobacter mediterraneus TaxID=83219 RepID=UPI001933E8EB|nr:MBL fold metallo-hydrolase [Sulfitobacter mediterraneus]MBM1634482.1 MBL fold metallo-hydrolase [Sulfitobacter mediterraneus]MBM1642299.1 MBL fold metallo-hydrolase [Sulfitobacter mediterraneus]MBM1646348.1 MBL fold metallo-hydrolase [Sulfitobacter mediterraneus]MBM1650394.1 MBL fold metallo-hydrolase [Sulfitobacter mediterraneus]MBM1654416.1 MBL fold metallo-hydrolase [Sulfitobacter mediterraneus]
MTYPVDLSVKPDVSAHFDEATNTITYIVKDPSSNHCAIIDSVMDINYAAGRITYDHADALIKEITDRGLTLDWIIETHVHADHLSAAPYLQEKLGGRIGVGEKILVVQDTFGKIFNEGTEFQRDGSQFDALFKDGDTYTVGNMQGFAMYTPGHTPACMVHVMGNAAFAGDTLFMPDGGSARADFPGGDAGQLYDSIQKVLSLPDEMRLFMCHDYGPNGRAIMWETTVAEQKADNIHVGGGKTREEFIKFRTERDKQLDVPKLIIPSLQVNMRAGEVPTDKDGNPMLKVPVNGL